MKYSAKKSIWHILSLVIAIGVSMTMLSCSDSNTYTVFDGKLNATYVAGLNGFPELKASLLEQHDMSEKEFIALSTAYAANLSDDKRTRLRLFRNDLMMPNRNTLLQKVISLSDVANYMENVYGGTIGGFISVAADMKQVRTMYDIYWGLRLDFTGSKFKEDGAGYAIIRFYPTETSTIIIPYSVEMGGKTEGEWPFGGGGFTTSTLGNGGYPEYKYSNGYYAPAEGAELYECTTNGNEILRSVFKSGRWTTAEGSTVKTRSDVQTVTPRMVTYRGRNLYLRGATTEGVHLFTSDTTTAKELGMEVYERGVYRIIVPASAIN